MKTSLLRKFPYVAAVLLYAQPIFAQDIGIGTFSDLVDQARQASPQPTPTPSPIVLEQAPNRKMLIAAEATPSPTPPFFSAPTVGVEYDYRRIQQRPFGGLSIDVDEVHFPFSFNLASTKFAVEYVHVWTEGANDIGGKLSTDSNGLKMTISQPIGQQLVFSLPVFYSNADGDGVFPTGAQTFSMYSIAMNPLLAFSIPLRTAMDPAGKPKPDKEQPLTLSISSGYRIGLSEKNDIRPISPDVDSWMGLLISLVQAEYAPKIEEECDHKGDNKWKISGNVTWTHLTNFYSSKIMPRPDDNSFGLGATFTYNFITFKPKDQWQPKLSGKITYQYDGFGNRDQYQHSITLVGTYRFW